MHCVLNIFKHNYHLISRLKVEILWMTFASWMSRNLHSPNFRIRQQWPRAVQGVRGQGLGLPLRCPQLRGMQGRNVELKCHTELDQSRKQSSLWYLCALEILLAKRAVDAVIASIKCFCNAQIMRFSGPTSCNNLAYFSTKRNFPRSSSLQWQCWNKNKRPLNKSRPQSILTVCESKRK